MRRRREHICLSIFGRCGSLFFHSLFDGHPQLSTIPGIAPYKVLSAFVKLRQSGTFGQLQNLPGTISNMFCGIFNNPSLRADAGLDRLGALGSDVAAVDPKSFFAHLRAMEDGKVFESLQGLSESMHDAFDASTGQSGGDKVFLQLHTMRPDDSAAILSELHHRHVIFLVREPIDNIESCANDLLGGRLRHRNRLTKFYDIIDGMLLFQRGQSFLDNTAIAVRLEDLKRHKDAFLRKLCAAIELDFDESLLHSTAMGLQYHSAPTNRNPGISGFSTHSPTPLGYRLTARDRQIFAALFNDITGFMDYPRQADMTLQEVATYLDHNILDVEIAFARMIGMPLADFGLQSDAREFRTRLTAMAQAKPAGLNCRRLLFTE